MKVGDRSIILQINSSGRGIHLKKYPGNHDGWNLKVIKSCINSGIVLK